MPHWCFVEETGDRFDADESIASIATKLLLSCYQVVTKFHTN
jgi:hypothetical protein